MFRPPLPWFRQRSKHWNNRPARPSAPKLELPQRTGNRPQLPKSRPLSNTHCLRSISKFYPRISGIIKLQFPLMKKFVFRFFSCFLISSVAFGQVCPKPQSPISLAHSNQQAVLDWQSSSSHWQLRYGQGNSQISSPVLVSSKPYTLTGLSPAQNYWVQVRDSCGLDSLGPWSDTLFIRTRCSAISSPWIEDEDTMACYEYQLTMEEGKNLRYYKTQPLRGW